jgi:hypothetical protein
MLYFYFRINYNIGLLWSGAFDCVYGSVHCIMIIQVHLFHNCLYYSYAVCSSCSIKNEKGGTINEANYRKVGLLLLDGHGARVTYPTRNASRLVQNGLSINVLHWRMTVIISIKLCRHTLPSSSLLFSLFHHFWKQKLKISLRIRRL